MTDRVSYIGMDLGTFKTSIAASNGRRDVIPTAVGWPKDHVARALLGRDVVFGDEIFHKRRALEVIRPFEKGMLKYGGDPQGQAPADRIARCREAARLVVEYAVSLMRPERGVPIFGVIGAPARASIRNKQVLIEAAESTFDAVVVVSEPFTVAYGMNNLSDSIVIDIGAGTIDLCPLYGTYPADADQVTLPLGGDMIDEAFCRLLAQKHPQAQFTPQMAREIKEKHGFVHDANEHAQVLLSVNGVPTQYDVTDPLKAACSVIVEPIVEGLGRLIARLDPEYRPRMLSNIVLAGGGSQLRGLDRVLEERLEAFGGGRVRRVGDSVFAGAAGALKLAMAMPAEYWQEIRRASENREASDEGQSGTELRAAA
ncbi:MAG: rod shape-determining protein [Planctomycetes bacterium]|nr:rod shape-determining protein [Planctomycetota bacterium]